MIKYIHLRQQFDVARMQQELAALTAATWKDHFNRGGYEGGWSTLQLRAVDGRIDNNVAKPASSALSSNVFQDTPLLAQCPYFREVLDFFEIEKAAVRLMKLDAHAAIKPHHDHELNFEQGEVRLHIPVVTNPELKFYLEEERVVMDEGSCWYLNLSLTHSVRNDGATPRVHLVIDGYVNDWLKAYFQQPQHTVQLMPDPQPDSQYSSQDKRAIIAQLRSLRSATADQLADEMEASLA